MSKEHYYHVYILTNKRNGTLYIGVTSNLTKRIHEHKEHITPGFTTKYGIDKLVYYETTEDIEGAIQREKQLKRWKRQWKIRLIEETNPSWEDLYDTLYDDPGSLPAHLRSCYGGHGAGKTNGK